MRSRLFWKILLGFWVTIICMLQGVGVAYSVAWKERSSYAYEVASAVAPYQLAAARMALETGGTSAYEQLLTPWKLDAEKRPTRNTRWAGEQDWIRLSLADPQRRTPPTEGSGERSVLSVLAIDPLAKTWELRYQLPEDTRYDPWSLQDFLRFYLTLEWAIPGLLFGLLFSAGLAWYLAQPMRRLRRGFRALAEGELDTRLHAGMGRRRDEIADLAQDFDRMAERLQQLVVARDRLLHDVSHELRSPLARLSLAVVLAGKESGLAADPLNRIASEVRRLDELVGELLSLSRCESGSTDSEGYFDMRSLVETVVADARFEAQSKGVSIVWEFATDEQTLMQGSGELIRRAVENIVRNAVQFSPKGSAVEIRLTVSHNERNVAVQVLDSGPGVPEQDLGRIHDPFVRLHQGTESKGYGLGLAIAHRAVLGHRGTLRVRNRRGGGLEVTVSLPLAGISGEQIDLA